MRPLDELAHVPIENLVVGDAAFRRGVQNAGYATLPALFDASDAEVDRRFGRDFRFLDMLDDLKNAYEKDPEGFVSRVTQKKSSVSGKDSGQTFVIRSQTTSRHSAKPHSVSKHRETRRLSHGYIPPMPHGEIGESLKGFEERAKASFDALEDRGTDYLAYEAFEDFPDLDDLSECFEKLFFQYRHQLSTAYAIAEGHLPNSFIVFCANQIRMSFDGDNLWGNLFASLGVSTQNRQQEFKQLMISCLKKRGMPTYGSDERDYYYFYTALLHGGLTTELWEDLWEKSLLPMAKKAVHDPYAFGRRLDGRVVLTELRGGKYSPGTTVMNAIGKAADATLVPLFDAAIAVARRMSEPTTELRTTMLSRSNLPETALEALSEIRKRERKSTGKACRGGGETSGASSSLGSELLYLPEGKLVLDLDIGQARIIWKRNSVDDSYMGARVDFFVNGELLRSAEVVRDIHGCFIGEGSASLPPMPGYEVVIKLMRKSRGAWVEEASLQQMFMRTKPGCLEFLQTPDGSFRLRRRQDRITRTRTVAYVIKPGRKIVPGPGMKPLETLFTSADWGDRMIFLFEIAPGSSGTIIEEESGRELAAWQEDFTVTVDKSGCIGRTAERLDLYGVIEGETSDNESLPDVTVAAADGIAALNDLEVTLACDERRLSVGRRVVWREGEQEATVVLSLHEVAFLPHFAKHCTLVIRRKTLGVSVFTYSFAVVPIMGPFLSDVDPKTMLATYTLTAAEPVWIRESNDHAAQIERKRPFSFCAPLSNELVMFEFRHHNNGLGIRVNLRLVGMSIRINDETEMVAEDHPLSFADAYEMGMAKGEIAITAYGACENRRALLMLGERPVFYADMSRPGTHYINIFSSPDLLLCLPGYPFEKDLNLTVFFGDPSLRERSWADLALLRCQEGLGFIRPQVLCTPNGHVLYLGMSAKCDLGAEFFWPESYTREERVVYECRIPKGEIRVDLPDKLVRKLNARRQMWVRYFPVTLFDEPEYDYALTMPFER